MKKKWFFGWSATTNGNTIMNSRVLALSAKA
jgi:hypothetical protein